MRVSEEESLQFESLTSGLECLGRLRLILFAVLAQRLVRESSKLQMTVRFCYTAQKKTIKVPFQHVQTAEEYG